MPLVVLRLAERERRRSFSLAISFIPLGKHAKLVIIIVAIAVIKEIVPCLFISWLLVFEVFLECGTTAGKRDPGTSSSLTVRTCLQLAIQRSKQRPITTATGGLTAYCNLICCIIEVYAEKCGSCKKVPREIETISGQPPYWQIVKLTKDFKLGRHAVPLMAAEIMTFYWSLRRATISNTISIQMDRGISVLLMLVYHALVMRDLNSHCNCDTRIISLPQKTFAKSATCAQ